jgi:hypothetical protein
MATNLKLDAYELKEQIHSTILTLKKGYDFAN